LMVLDMVCADVVEAARRTRREACQVSRMKVNRRYYI
jgi:hypothetical protein